MDPRAEVAGGDHDRQPVESDDRVSVSEADELQQRRRHGRRVDHVLGRGRPPPRDRRGPLGVPPGGNGLPRARLRVESRHVRPHAGNRARRQTSPRSGGRVDRRRRPDRPVLVFPSAVQLGAQSLGIDPMERQWSRTGGLPSVADPGTIIRCTPSPRWSPNYVSVRASAAWCGRTVETRPSTVRRLLDRSPGRRIPARGAAGRNRRAPEARSRRRCRRGRSCRHRGVLGDVLARRRPGNPYAAACSPTGDEPGVAPSIRRSRGRCATANGSA